MTPPPPDKARVRASFDRAAATYDAAAALQARVCERLLEAWSPRLPADAFTLLDAGCGTGHGAQLLRRRWPQAQITGLDFAPAMLQRARPWMAQVCAADMEALPCPDASFDAWWSSLALQWCDPARALSEAARVLRPGGQLALSTLAPDTFHELREAFAQVDTRPHTLAFRTPEDLVQALAQAGLRVTQSRREPLVVHHPDLKSLLKEIKAVGANVVGRDGARQGLFGRRAWAALQTAYEAHRGPAGLPLSYDVLICTAEKPSAPL